MALPRIDHPTFNVEVPSSKKKISMRPFTVKEEKVLLMASSSKAREDVIEAVKQVINNCILTPDVDVEDFATFDLEYIFIKLRSQSVGNHIPITLKRGNETLKGVVNVDEDVKVVTNEDHVKTIEVNDKVSVTMRYPTFEVAALISEQPTEAEVFKVFNFCVDSIFDKETDELFSRPDGFTDEELTAFIESLPGDVFKKMTSFIETMPRVQAVIRVKSDTGKEEQVTLVGLRDFFQF